jgi:hypothetical protein
MKQIILSLALTLISVSLFSQETIKLNAKQLEVLHYNDNISEDYKKDVDSSFLIIISDTSVVLTSTYPRYNKVEYKITETIFSDNETKILRCKTQLGREIITTYHDAQESHNCSWVVIDYTDSEYRYKCDKN